MAVAWRRCGRVAVVGMAMLMAGVPAPAADPLVKTRVVWTYEEARQAFLESPYDAMTRFILIQTATSAGRLEEAEGIIHARRDRSRGNRFNDVDLFSLTAGSLAVEESLQLDTLLGDSSQSGNDFKGAVNVADLVGPGVKSHPWNEMLAGRQPEVSRLSLCVPDDFYFVESRSLSVLLDVMESGDLWQKHIAIQTSLPATAAPTSQRIRTQLAVELSDVLRPVYDTVIDRVAVTGSDLYFEEGNDVTLLFTLKQPEVFRVRMEGLLDAAAAQPGATSSSEPYRGVEIRHVETADRAIDVFAADPKADLHIRSNSAVAIRAVLNAILDEENTVTSLGETEEFHYIRTLMPPDAVEEDVLVYLSDPFIRRILGPRVKLTERRRLIGLSHLRMLGYAAVLFETQYGRPAVSIQELVGAGCAPAGFTNGEIVNPFGGKYSLAEDGLTAVCSVLGTANALTPGCELLLESVTKDEAEAYKQFVVDYEQYWRRYFDPIAVRIQARPDRYRAETIVLPLIDNSMYQGLLQAVGGEPADLQPLPVPKSNIGNISFHLNKEKLDGDFGFLLNAGMSAAAADGPRPPDLAGFLREGIGDSASFNVCDGDPLFDLNLTQFGALSFRFQGFDESIGLGMLVASLTSPVYIALPVKNRDVVDEFLADLDRHLALVARRDWAPGFFDLTGDYYLLDNETAGRPATRVMAVRIGPLTWRFYFARIGDGLYIASRASILDDIAAAKAGDPSPTRAHVRLQYRPGNWEKILASYQLGWAENARRAVLKNLGTLNPFVRTYLSLHPEADSTDPQDIANGAIRLAEKTLGREFLLPDGGRYELSKDGRRIVHSQYGDLSVPHQLAAPVSGGPLQSTIAGFGGLVAELTFLEDGLHAVVTIERKAP